MLEKHAKPIAQNVVAEDSEVSYGIQIKNGDKPDAFRASFLAGHTRCKSDYHCRFLEANHHCFMYFAKGNGSMIYGDREFSPKGGDLFLLHANEYWEYKTDPKRPWELYWVNLDTVFGTMLLDLYGLSDAVLLSYENAREHMRDIFDTLALTKRTNIDLRDEVMDKVLLLLRETSRVKDVAGDTKQCQDARAMCKYIHDHVGKNIRSTDVSACVFRSHSGAALLFRRFYGCSIKDYILKVKLETGARLLSETQVPIWKIAADLAFFDARHFSSLFASRYKMTPRAFRKSALDKKQKNHKDG